MTNDNLDLASLNELRGFVQRTICEHQHLVVGAFGFHEKLLVRGGQPCGLHFTMSGPRAVQFSAIWDAARHTILFYDCGGDRFHRSDLVGSPELRAELTQWVSRDELMPV